jgi:serine/threonine-protein kinase
MAGVWELGENASPSGSRREAVRTAILRSGVAGASRIWDRVSRLLDRHATRWLATYTEACEATHVRGEQSQEAFDLRMECMTENLESTRALSELLAEGADAIVSSAVQMVDSLDDYQRCSNVQQLRLGAPPPKDPRIRVEVAELRRKLKVADALVDAGQSEKSTGIAEYVVERAEALGYCPLLAEALAILGDGRLGLDPSLALSTMERAIFKGESCGADRVVARAAAEAVFGQGLHDWRGAERTAALARAALERIGGDPRIEGWLANNVGAVFYWQNRPAEALAEFERAFGIKTASGGLDSLDAARSESNVALALAKLGRFDQALASSQHVLNTFAKWVPEDSIWRATSLANHAYILFRVGRLQEAEAAAREVLRATPPAHPYRSAGNATRTLGLIAMERRQFPSAIEILERACRLQQDEGESSFEVAETKFALARAIEAAGAQRRRAERVAKEALTVFSSAQTFAAQRQEVAMWLSHPPHRSNEGKALP